ncbi:peptidoglycan-binding protein LysM [Paenibacillus monticola]|uniref:Peptidoglycan-binding protein LysM n=1 Tax=Paenibacillus monticola TaxID=2666075 RepID=A0A7X2L540_9BACL|nr:peptidoglycan-binding protein LysM [Paenibacillus monticola]MRN57159.1 peptidoglycan-binding protein LysM [Paenibacillus monticola]
MAEKAKIIPLDMPVGAIEVMFNPNEYTVSFEGKYTGEKNNKQFQITETPEFKVSLFYDTYEQRTDVRKKTKLLTSLLDPKVSGKSTKKPPVCMFVWGGFTYRGLLSKIEQKFTMFMDNGTPVRSLLDVTFITDEPDKSVEDSQGLNACRKLWVVKSGDRLDLIANEALKEPLAWRRIAELNRIVNPIGFPGTNDIGRTLVIPD